jgi:hypothetical protein
MTTRVKKAKIIGEIPILHSCTKVAAIKKQSTMLKEFDVYLKRLNEVTLGNGHKEDGLLFIVRKFVQEHEIVLKDIKEIKDKFSNISEINLEFELQRRVKIEKEKILQEIKETDELKLKHKTFSWGKVPIIGGVITIIIILIFQILNYDLNRKTKEDTSDIRTETRVTNDVLIPPGTTRGQHYVPPIFDTTKIK